MVEFIQELTWNQWLGLWCIGGLIYVTFMPGPQNEAQGVVRLVLGGPVVWITFLVMICYWHYTDRKDDGR